MLSVQHIAAALRWVSAVAAQRLTKDAIGEQDGVGSASTDSGPAVPWWLNWMLCDEGNEASTANTLHDENGHPRVPSSHNDSSVNTSAMRTALTNAAALEETVVVEPQHALSSDTAGFAPPPNLTALPVFPTSVGTVDAEIVDGNANPFVVNIPTRQIEPIVECGPSSTTMPQNNPIPVESGPNAPTTTRIGHAPALVAVVLHNVRSEFVLSDDIFVRRPRHDFPGRIPHGLCTKIPRIGRMFSFVEKPVSAPQVREDPASYEDSSFGDIFDMYLDGVLLPPQTVTKSATPTRRTRRTHRKQLQVAPSPYFPVPHLTPAIKIPGRSSAVQGLEAEVVVGIGHPRDFEVCVLKQVFEGNNV